MHPLRTLLLFSLLILFSLPAKATHIVGGEMNYTCLGNNQYEIELVVFRDCYNGDPLAWFDSPASIGIFDGESNQFISQLLIPWDPVLNDTLDPVLSSNCFVVPPDVCVHTTTYTATVNLPPSKSGYILAYQRCCRNQTITNIVNPLATGATYSVFISAEAIAGCNSNPKFQEWPPLYICVNEPLNFDQSAIDTDGDSLVYKLCTPLDGADQFFPMPQPPNPPPYAPITWIDPPYNVDNMLNSAPGDPLLINSETGFLSGTPNTIGQFVVGICIDEFRDGVLISTTRRDFQYNVGECGEITSSFFAPSFQCGDFTVDFENESTNASSYLWLFNDPNNPGASSTDFEPSYTYSDAGTYTITLIAEPGSACPDTFSQELILNYSSLNANFTHEFVDCSDSITVQLIDLSTDSVSTPSEWLWELSTGQTFTGQNPAFTMAAGDEIVIDLLVTAENGCTASTSMLLVGPQPLLAVVAGSDPICFGSFNGSALAEAIGGITPFEYEWSDGQTSALATDLDAGVYTVVITDALGCTAEATVELFSPLELELSLTKEDVSCFGAADGQVSASVTGGTTPYTYLWSNDSTTATITGLTAGLYTVTVTDSVACEAIDSMLVESPPALELTLGSQNESCFEAADGQASVAIDGGTPPYNILWSNNETADTISGLASGQYLVTVTDANACEAVDSVTISGPPPLELDVVELLQPCEGDSTGSIEVAASGGTPPYDLNWDNGLSGDLLTGLPGGTYIVTLTDANNCELLDTIPLLAFDNPDISVDEVTPACFGGNTGSITVSGIGGQGPYTFEWSTTDPGTNVLEGLPTGTYSVTITDANGCMNNTSIEVAEEDPVPCLATIVQPISVYNGSDGIITVADPADGTAPFTYLWDNGSTTATIDGLAAGTYAVTVTDANDCQYPCEVTLENPSKIGDFVWDDLDEDGQQDPDEPGYPGIDVTLTGVDMNGDPVLKETTTDADGKYVFDGLIPGDYELTFSGIPIEYGFTQTDVGNDDTDNDADADGQIPTFTIGYDEARLDLDAGILQVCFNVTDPGEIAGDEVLCGPGNDPSPIIEVAPPTGGMGDLEYLWMSRVEGGVWTPIPNTDSPTYDPGPIFETTYFVRCVRRENCIQFVEPDPIVKIVDDVAVAEITAPQTICVGDEVTFSAADSGPDAAYQWVFGLMATPPTSTEQNVAVTWNQYGVYNVKLTVTNEGCTAYNYHPVFVTNSPLICDLTGQGQEANALPPGAPIPGKETYLTPDELEVFPNPNQGQVTVRWQTELVEDSFIELYDTNGQRLRSFLVSAGSKAAELQMQDLPAGLYLLRMLNDQQQWSTSRVVKQ